MTRALAGSALALVVASCDLGPRAKDYSDRWCAQFCDGGAAVDGGAADAGNGDGGQLDGGEPEDAGVPFDAGVLDGGLCATGPDTFSYQGYYTLHGVRPLRAGECRTMYFTSMMTTGPLPLYANDSGVTLFAAPDCSGAPLSMVTVSTNTPFGARIDGFGPTSVGGPGGYPVSLRSCAIGYIDVATTRIPQQTCAPARFAPLMVDGGVAQRLSNVDFDVVATAPFRTFAPGTSCMTPFARSVLDTNGTFAVAANALGVSRVDATSDFVWPHAIALEATKLITIIPDLGLVGDRCTLPTECLSPRRCSGGYCQLP